MISHKPTKVALILVATLFATGCALKPRQASRFHASGSANCDCYTCRNESSGNSYGYAENVTSGSAINGTPFSQTQENVISVESPQMPVVAPAISPSIPPRKLYEYPKIAEPVVSKEWESPKSATENETENPVNEVDAENSPSDQLLDLNSNEGESLEGGSFKPTAAKKEVAKTEATPTEPTPAATKPAPEPATAPETIREPTPASAPAPVDAETVEPKKTKSSLTPGKKFSPGESFKPRKPLDSSSWKSSENFQGIDPFKSESSKVAQAPEPLKVPQDDPIDSFFAKDDEPVAKQLPQPTGDKIVLRANPVERNVVYMPPSRSASKVVVPALKTTFKGRSAANWLRETSPRFAANSATESSGQRTYQSTASSNIVPQTTKEAPAEAKAPVVAVQPRTLPVRLRAIPMNQQMIKGKQVDIRFREHIPADQNVVATTGSQPKAIPAPVAMLATPQLEVALPVVALPESGDEIELPLAIPAVPDLDSVHEHTARAVKSDDIATPPWRIK